MVTIKYAKAKAITSDFDNSPDQNEPLTFHLQLILQNLHISR